MWLDKEHNTVLYCTFLYKNLSQYIKYPLKINTVASHVDVFHSEWTFVHLEWKQITADSSKIFAWTVNLLTQNGSSFKDMNDIYFFSLDGGQESSSVNNKTQREMQQELLSMCC